MSLKKDMGRLASAGITEEMIPRLPDKALLAVAGIGPKGLASIRQKFGRQFDKDEPLEEKVFEALWPVLRQQPGVGRASVRSISRAVAAFYGR